MPNWCSTVIKFYSENREQLEAMHKKFNEIRNGKPMGLERQCGLKYDNYLMKVQDDSIKGEVGMRYEIRRVA